MLGKVCTKCGHNKPLTDFYPVDRLSFGVSNMCRACEKIRRAAYYALNADHAKSLGKKWRKENPEKQAALATAWLARNPVAKYPEKVAARNAVNSAVRAGTLVKPTFCENCWQDLPLEGHHPDYSKPLDVIWLCRQCHVDQHSTRKD
jgi:hypothetical protein